MSHLSSTVPFVGMEEVTANSCFKERLPFSHDTQSNLLYLSPTVFFNDLALPNCAFSQVKLVFIGLTFETHFLGVLLLGHRSVCSCLQSITASFRHSFHFSSPQHLRHDSCLRVCTYPRVSFLQLIIGKGGSSKICYND